MYSYFRLIKSNKLSIAVIVSCFAVTTAFGNEKEISEEANQVKERIAGEENARTDKVHETISSKNTGIKISSGDLGSGRSGGGGMFTPNNISPSTSKDNRGIDKRRTQ